MLIFAPEEVKRLQYRIKCLHKNFINNNDFYLLEQLEKITQECDEKLLNENDYFEYKKWYYKYKIKKAKLKSQENLK